MKITIPAFRPMAKCNEHLAHGAFEFDLGDDIVQVPPCSSVCRYFGTRHQKCSCCQRNFKNLKDCFEPSDDKFVCVANCPELDSENLPHCRCKNEAAVQRESERWPDGCPCGNTAKWEAAK